MIDTKAAREVLLKMTRGEFTAVTGDCRHRLNPGDSQRQNRTASWTVGPDSRSRQQAELDSRGFNFLRNNAAAWLDALEAQKNEIERLKGELDSAEVTLDEEEVGNVETFAMMAAEVAKAVAAVSICIETAVLNCGYSPKESAGIARALAVIAAIRSRGQTVKTRFLESGRHPPLGFPGDDDPRQTKEMP